MVLKPFGQKSQRGTFMTYICQRHVQKHMERTVQQMTNKANRGYKRMKHQQPKHYKYFSIP